MQTLLRIERKKWMEWGREEGKEKNKGKPP
jgi:hypothetical protein